MEWMYSPEAWVALATLTFLEIVLGIDNIIFIAILVGRLPPEQRKRGRVIGLASDVEIMILAIVIAVAVMMVASGPISDFVDTHPTIKMLALSFLVLIGVALIGEGLEFHIPKGYIYFAMAFSVAVEMLNLGLRRRAVAPIELRKHIDDE